MKDNNQMNVFDNLTNVRLHLVQLNSCMNYSDNNDGDESFMNYSNDNDGDESFMNYSNNNDGDESGKTFLCLVS